MAPYGGCKVLAVKPHGRDVPRRFRRLELGEMSLLFRRCRRWGEASETTHDGRFLS